MSKTRCKFVCQECKIGNAGDGLIYTYKLAAVTSGSPENEEFWKWTPNGELNFDCVAQRDAFIPGEEYYIDISPVKDLKKIEG